MRAINVGESREIVIDCYSTTTHHERNTYTSTKRLAHKDFTKDGADPAVYYNKKQIQAEILWQQILCS